MEFNLSMIYKQLRKIVWKITCTIIIFFLQLNINAQKVWTLDDCITYGLENNLSIKQQEYETSISKNNYIRSYADLSPSIRGSVGINHFYGRTFNDETLEFTNNDYESGYYSINASMLLFNGFQTLNSIRRNYFIHKADMYNLERNKIDIILAITEKYYNILYFTDVLDITKEQYRISQTQLDKSEALVTLGKASRVDYLNVKAQSFSDKENVIRTENSLKLLILDFSQLLNIDSIANFSLQKVDSISDTIFSPDIIYQEAVINNPKLKSAEYQLKSSEKNLSIARGNRSPQVSVGASYGSNFNQLSSNPRGDNFQYSYKDQLNDKINRQIGLSISIPIYNKFLVQNNISNAKIIVDKSKIEVEQVRQTLYNEIFRAQTDAQTALEKYHTKIETINSLSEAFQIMQEKFNMGLVNAIEFGISKNNLFIAQTDLFLAKYEYSLKIAYLQLYSGAKYNKFKNN